MSIVRSLWEPVNTFRNRWTCTLTKRRCLGWSRNGACGRVAPTAEPAHPKADRRTHWDESPPLTPAPESNEQPPTLSESQRGSGRNRTATLRQSDHFV